MKRCPECRRDYYDDSLAYCLDDGTALLEGPASGDKLSDGPATAEPKTQTLPHIDPPGEAVTKIQISEPSSGEFISTSIRKHKVGTAIGLVAALVVISGFGYGLYSLFKGAGGSPQAVKQQPIGLKMQPMTAVGTIREAAISPDGKFLAYTENKNGEAAVWTKQISTNSNVQIAPPTKMDYFALKFSPNGEYVFYGIFESGGGTIYRVPTLGGAPVKIVSDAYGQISLSPDGNQFVFERYEQHIPESALMIVNADGTGERKLAARTGRQFFVSPSASWSPDGKSIAVAVGDDSFEHFLVFAIVDVATGGVTEFGKQRFDSIGHSAWLHDGSGLVFLGSDRGNNVAKQIWTVSYPAGDASQLTHDLSGYAYLTMTADSKSIVVARRDSFGAVWFAKNGDIKTVEQISRGKLEGTWGIALAPDGRVIYVSNISGATEVWIMNNDGTGAKQLTNDGISKYTPAVTSDGRYIVFISEKNGRHLWRMNIDGSQPVQLTTGVEEGNPTTTADGKHVIYDTYLNGKQVLMSIPIEGGEPQQLTDFQSLEAGVSPDNKYIAYFYVDEQGGKNIRLGVMPAEGGSAIKTYDVPQSVAVDNSPVWTPDGRGITYIDWTAEVSNLWVQPFDGGAPKQLTNYKQGYIFRREWSRDGKQLAIVRGTETSDAVMITDFR